jgi:hypothetical protein
MARRYDSTVSGRPHKGSSRFPGSARSARVDKGKSRKVQGILSYLQRSETSLNRLKAVSPGSRNRKFARNSDKE